jgi:SAM-dependent methyltransferase
MNKVISRWNEKYAAEELVFGTTPNEFLARQAPLYKPGGKILCVGDGEGRNGVWLAEEGFHVLSIDGARNGVEKAIRQAEIRGVSERFTGECADLLNWHWPTELFDGVACYHLYFMPDERKIMHQAMMDSLKDNGLFTLEVFHPDHVGRGCGGPALKELCYRAQDLEDDFKAYQILHLEECERELAPSSFHDGGIAAVTRIVVRNKTK